MKTSSSQSGFVHFIAIIAAVVVLGAVGWLGWQAFSKNAADKTLDVASSQARAECEKENDKDICRFVTNWKTSAKYSMVSTGADGSKSTYEIDGDKTRMVMSGEFAYEVVSVGKTTYTKAGDVWYKQTIKDPKDDVTADAKIDFKEPANDSNETESKDKTVYKKLAKEPCGNLTCFKYEVVDSTNTDTKEFIWFDDKDYKLRKSVSESSEGKTETTFEYDNVSVAIPSPAKELAPNQYIVPGQLEPQTIPTMPDISE